MHPAILPAALVFSFSLAMAAYVVALREKRELHWLLLGALVSLMTWTLGTMLRFSVTTEGGLHASLRLIFLGVFATPAFWMLLAASYARLRLTRRRWFQLATVSPGVIAYLFLLTNEGHGLMIREVSFEALESGGRAWVGPVFWAFLAWAWLCLAGGIVTYLATAGRLVRGDERWRGLLLALASAVPLVVSPLYLFGWVPVSFDLTPSSICLSLLIVSTTIFRYRLLQSPPLAHRDVIARLRDGVVMASPAGAVVEVNEAAEGILGQPIGGLRRRPLEEVLVELAAPAERASLLESLVGLEAGEPRVVREISTPDERWISILAARVWAPDGADAGRFALLRDRTDERRLERLLRQNERLQSIGTLAAGIAHEVNNPLAFIRSNLSQLHALGERAESHRPGETVKWPEELCDLRQIAEETLDGIGRIERIVADMRGLATAREAGSDPFAPVRVNDVVRDAIRLADLARAPTRALRTELEEGLPSVLGSAERLVQALLNLLVNAKHAVEKSQEPHIAVHTQLCEGAVEICVCDNGPGVEAEHQERIFDPFFTTKGPDRGTGLGLAIAYDIVRDHGGVLELRSRPAGGAAFLLRLPLATDQGTP